ncbi:MAG TPA: hypothetical protein PKX56_04915 [Marmoricola sp.]|nr:hypothetical protein [Marmoricola sp.]HNJ78675.1 hypothetical protein [Marmoricola sp.]HNO39029.1 hypothetical protein [Marmoricola sp.]
MRRVFIAFATGVLLLSGCTVSVGDKPDAKSSTSPSSVSSPTTDSGDSGVDPADAAPAGITISGTGFSFSAPKGWEDIKDQMGAQFAAAARETGQSDGFADNVNVIRSGSSGITMEQLKESVPGQLQGAGGKNIQIHDDVTIDGQTAAHATAEIPVNNGSGIVAHTTQYYVITDDAEYVITITSQGGFDDAKTKANVARIVSSWQWQ